MCLMKFRRYLPTRCTQTLTPAASLEPCRVPHTRLARVGSVLLDQLGAEKRFEFPVFLGVHSPLPGPAFRVEGKRRVKDTVFIPEGKRNLVAAPFRVPDRYP